MDFASPPFGQRIQQHDGSTDASDLAGDIEGLKIEEDGRISFHGPTSFFQLPSGLALDNPNPILAEQCADGRKERLINNAWRERAFEQLTTIPVCSRKQYRFKWVHVANWLRNHSNIF